MQKVNLQARGDLQQRLPRSPGFKVALGRKPRGEASHG
jgi:hypothetical protein